MPTVETTSLRQWEPSLVLVSPGPGLGDSLLSVVVLSSGVGFYRLGLIGCTWGWGLSHWISARRLTGKEDRQITSRKIGVMDEGLDALPGGALVALATPTRPFC